MAPGRRRRDDVASITIVAIFVVHLLHRRVGKLSRFCSVNVRTLYQNTSWFFEPNGDCSAIASLKLTLSE